MKFVEISAQLFEEFTSWKEQKMVVHDRDLKEAALIIAANLGLPHFKVNYFDSDNCEILNRSDIPNCEIASKNPNSE